MQTKQASNCDDKLAFDSKKQAIAEATATKWRHGTKLKPYECKQCRLWHMASDYASN